jgi:hypothetical protein
MRRTGVALSDEELAALHAKAMANLDTPCPTHSPVEVLRLLAAIAARDEEIARLRKQVEECGRAGCPSARAVAAKWRQAHHDRVDERDRAKDAETRVAQLEARIVELQDDCDDAEALRKVVDEVARWRHTALPASIVSAYDKMMERKP